MTTDNLTVTKPFTTRTRRLREGQLVHPGEDLRPLGLDVLKARGFLAADDTEAAPKRVGRKGAKE